MGDQDYTILCYLVFGITVVSFALYFRSVWIKGGYEGTNKILELFEVTKVYAHLMGFLLILLLEVMILSERDYPPGAWTGVIGLLASVFASELYLDLKKSLINIKQEAHERKQDSDSRRQGEV